MDIRIRIGIALLLVACMALPAGAFTADRLDIGVSENGTATITFDYTLSWIERIGVFLKIADPSDEFKKALETFSGQNVESVSMNDSSASFRVEHFARISTAGNETTYTTPAIDLHGAEKALNNYWFAPLVQADFSPAVTAITFPDGSVETLENVSEIPTVSKTISTTTL
ncbi:MAG: hypothetical protein PWP08_1711 [Methanofollis sp.]|nr:hypothetical protein [Methanofollis sp.]